MSDERVAVFIDGSSLFQALKEEFHNLYIDFSILVAKLVDERRHICTNYYTAMPDQKTHPDRYARKKRFLDTLKEKYHIQVVLGTLERHKGTYVETGVDLALSVDMLDMAYQNIYDTAIVVSGDRDLTRAITAVQRMGKRVENAAAISIFSSDLRKISNKFTMLDEAFLEECWREQPT